MSDVILRNINKIYPNGVQAVFDFNIEIEHGEFIVLAGPSGCGKSTTLRMIAGLEDITSGDLIINNKRVNDVAPRDRDIAMVFQNYALYAHMTVYDNLAFSLMIRKVDDDEIHRRVMKAADILGLIPYLNRKPRQLSGGQRQRVAVGRAIVRNPIVFLLDEPLSNLDAKLRAKTRSEIVRLQKRLNITTIYVTHDQIEAMTMADRIVVMKDGYIQQIGTPYEVYHNPNNIFVGGFIGTPPMNFFKGKIVGNFFKTRDLKVKITPKKLELLKKYYNDIEGREIIIGIRPEYTSCENYLMQENKDSIVNLKVVHKEFLGKYYDVELACDDTSFIIKVESRNDVNKDTLDVAILEDKIHFFDVDTTNRVDKE